VEAAAAEEEVAAAAEAVAVAAAEAAAVVAAGRAVAEPVREQGPGQERERELAPETEPGVAAVTILTSVHTDRRTRAASAGERFRFKGAGSAGSTNTRPTLTGTCGGTRRNRAIFSGLTRLSGQTPPR
jgi:hypothetical protein